MSPKDDRRAVTLSISMSPELSAEVSTRVETGLYSSASEVLREALRLLIRTEGVRVRALEKQACADAQSSARFAAACDLMDLGLEMEAEQVRLEAPELTPAGVRARMEELACRQDVGPGLRVAADRLEKLRIR